MTNRFGSKEVTFLKNNSDHPGLISPEKYFSDLAFSGNDDVKKFKERLKNTKIPGKSFLCAVIQISPEAREKTGKEDCFKTVFDSVLKQGIWKRLDEDSFALGFWGYAGEEDGGGLLVSLKKKLSAFFTADILVGWAKFPYHDFKKSHTLYNALKAIDHATFFGPDSIVCFDAVSLNISGDRLYELARYDEAAKEYKKGLEIENRNVNLINSLGVCFGIMGRLKKAKKEFEKAIEINPNELMSIYNISLIHKINKKNDRAIKYLKKAREIDDNIFEVKILLGYLLFKKGYFEEAFPHLEKAGQINPDSGLAFRIKGEIMLEKKELEKAGLEFNKAVKINPSDTVSLSGYARSLELQGKNLGIALIFAQKSIDIEPDNELFKNRFENIKKKLAQTAQ